ncbi:MAG: single-stranded-DNA-specific exonuclease RecJ [Rickettsiaceae bacterium]|nr:single-stranded-DNA-specific exonuclease RecJ [Rickettsiaceae bacterium]MDP5083681.1 single-stranded-DNA-specific exonuclease RecJ [Rickettsiaceae bacterium]
MTKSSCGKYWRSRDYDEGFISDLARVLKISDLLARLLSSRVSSLEEAEQFLDPKIKSQLPDPMHLKDMEQAIERTIKAIQASEKICIFADYDVDGATSSALLLNIFRELQVNASIYVPDRISEGYGPTVEAMRKIHKSGVSLLITVDCGSVAFEALDAASDIGMDVIVIDHHISMDNLPKAVAVINPNRLDETSECKNLAAVGVSFLFAVALLAKLKSIDYFQKKNLAPPNLIKQLDLVALGTVCDVMQLTGLNRAFVKQGLKVARSRGNIGYKTLCDVANIQEAINCYHLGFVLGPRINAGGRVGKSSLGATLLSTNSALEAHEIATELDRHNEERKVIEFTMIEEANAMAEAQKDDPMLFIKGEGWHPGVIGIVAGRLKEKYNKPVAVIAVNEGIGKASCRSIKGVDFGCKLIEAKQHDLLIAGGGHAMAAGFTAKETKLGELQEFLNNKFKKDLDKSDAHLYEYYDIDLTSSAATLDLVSEIECIEPFGVGNQSPTFRFSNLYVLKADVVGAKHIKVVFAPEREAYGSKPLTAIAFNVVGTEMGDKLLSRKPHSMSVFGKLKVNKWQDRETVQLQLSDLLVSS